MFTPVEADGSCQVAGNISRNAVTQSPLLGRYRSSPARCAATSQEGIAESERIIISLKSSISLMMAACIPGLQDGLTLFGES